MKCGSQLKRQLFSTYFEIIIIGVQDAGPIQHPGGLIKNVFRQRSSMDLTESNLPHYLIDRVRYLSLRPLGTVREFNSVAAGRDRGGYERWVFLRTHRTSRIQWIYHARRAKVCGGILSGARVCIMRLQHLKWPRKGTTVHMCGASSRASIGSCRFPSAKREADPSLFRPGP